jgi:hypothetical protein
VGAAIQEVMESYEVEINGKVFQGATTFDFFYPAEQCNVEKAMIIETTFFVCDSKKYLEPQWT